VSRAPCRCTECGAPFTARAARGRLPRYCTIRCKRTHDLRGIRERRAQRSASRPPHRRECVECGREFFWPAQKRPWPKYCSRPCKGARHRRRLQNRVEISVCARCGSEFLRIDRPRPRVHCESCLPPPQHRREPRTCRNCGVAYLPKSAERITFCSRTCSYAFRRATRLARRERKEAARRKRAFRECRICGHLFRATKLVLRICSKECRRRKHTNDAYRHRTGRNREEALRPRPCRGCGKIFPPSRPNALFCSKVCLKHARRRSEAGRAAKRRWRTRSRARRRPRQGAVALSQPGESS
jgi:hypothetical protein